MGNGSAVVGNAGQIHMEMDFYIPVTCFDFADLSKVFVIGFVIFIFCC